MPKMQDPRVVIRCNDESYLDGFNGDVWETTPLKRNAWRMTKQEAEQRLLRVKKQFPNAMIERSR